MQIDNSSTFREISGTELFMKTVHFRTGKHEDLWKVALTDIRRDRFAIFDDQFAAISFSLYNILFDQKF